MRSTDPVEPTGLDDHCLVHQFIRIHGRRPTAEELSSLADGAVAVPPRVPPVVPPARRSTPGAVSGLRRELARLINRATPSHRSP